MRKMFFLVAAYILTACSSMNGDQKIFVVQRDREAVFVLDGKKESEIVDLGNLNHATIKFENNFGYVLARNGYVTKFNAKTNEVVRKVKYGKSGIGLTFTKDYLAIVNYEPKSVMLLDKDLNLIKTIETESRNVGVKSYKDLIIFSLMDKNEIWVVSLNEDFKIIKKFTNVGKLPFDALINENYYVVGFFDEASIGVLDIEKMNYEKLALKDLSDSPVLKVPHFGYWGILNNNALVPLANNNKIIALNLKDISVFKEINLFGSPVFAAISPNKKKMVVNFSGDKEDYIGIIDIEKLQVEKQINVGRRVMHFRFVENGDFLFVSSYFDNKLSKIRTDSWEVVEQYVVPSPSGIFINSAGEK